MRIGYPPCFIDLTIIDVIPPSQPRGGDVHLQVNASIGDYLGTTSCWLDSEKLRLFSIATHQLYLSFQGDAHLQSLSPGELSLSLSPSDPSGIVLVRVDIGKHYPVRCTLSGEFEVELQALANIVNWSESPCLEH